MAGWILLGAAVVLGLSVAVLSHGLVKVRDRIASAWAHIDIQLRWFPARLVALQLRAREYFRADDTSRGPVQVDF